MLTAIRVWPKLTASNSARRRGRWTSLSIYRALADRQVDLIAGDATSGLIDAYGLTMLKDDRRYFPPYDAVPVARRGMLLAHPQVKDALATLAGKVTVADMRRMNRAVDAEHQEPAAVVRAFLQARPR